MCLLLQFHRACMTTTIIFVIVLGCLVEVNVWVVSYFFGWLDCFAWKIMACNSVSTGKCHESCSSDTWKWGYCWEFVRENQAVIWWKLLFRIVTIHQNFSLGKRIWDTLMGISLWMSNEGYADWDMKDKTLMLWFLPHETHSIFLDLFPI